MAGNHIRRFVDFKLLEPKMNVFVELAHLGGLNPSLGVVQNSCGDFSL